MTRRTATGRLLPTGREAQCPLCDRIFGSDSSCERHKPYRLPVSAECKDPRDVGMEPRLRQGVEVWVVPMPAAVPMRAVEGVMSP